MNTLTEQLIRDEGLRLKPYRDTVGKLTIGVGRNLDDRGITEDEAMALLEHDITDIRDAFDCDALRWTVRLDEARQAVLHNMAFTLGVKGLLHFRHMLAAVERMAYAEAAREMLDSTWARQVGDRAHRLARQMETGEWA